MKNNSSSSVAGSSVAGLGLGNFLAAILSYSVNQSLCWAFLHGLFGWSYLIYYFCGCGHAQ
jgi:hypothetical protein